MLPTAKNLGQAVAARVLSLWNVKLSESQQKPRKVRIRKCQGSRQSWHFMIATNVHVLGIADTLTVGSAMSMQIPRPRVLECRFGIAAARS